MKESRHSIRGMSASAWYGCTKSLLTATPTLDYDLPHIGKVIVQIITIALVFLISPSNGQGINIMLASVIYFLWAHLYSSRHPFLSFVLYAKQKLQLSSFIPRVPQALLEDQSFSLVLSTVSQYPTLLGLWRTSMDPQA